MIVDSATAVVARPTSEAPAQLTVESGAVMREPTRGLLQQMRDNFKEDLAQTTKSEEETQLTSAARVQSD